MLWGIIGDYGSGKTVFLTTRAYISFLNKIGVLANYTLKGCLKDYYEKINPIDLKEIGFNKTVCIDELQLWLDSRLSASNVNLALISIIDQSRHRDIDIYGTYHTYMSIDVRFRSQLNRLVKCERVWRKGVSRDLRDFRYSIMNMYDGRIIRKILKYDIAKDYFKLFDTKEIVEAINDKKFEMDIYDRYPNKKYWKINELAQEIISEGKKFTHAKVQLALLKRDYPTNWSSLIYSRILELKQTKGVRFI